MSSIGFRIKTLRKHLKMSQIDFSRAIGISQGTLSDIENDKSYPATETILSLFGYIEISADWLLKGTGTWSMSPESPHSELTQWQNLYNQAPANVRPYLISMVQAFLQNLPKETNIPVKNLLISPSTEDAAAIHDDESNIA